MFFSLDTKSIIVENNFPEVFAENNVHLRRARFYNLSVAEKSVIKFLKKNIIKKKKSNYQGFIFHFNPEWLQRISMSRLAVALHNTCCNAGFNPDNCDRASKAKNNCDVVEVNLTSKVTQFKKSEFTFNVFALTYGII
uniref:Uncharacterized protein n=1 Tax=Panagrellus redivivus TaxID=6233 RepID=A0A7E4VT94_PANRE